MVQLLSKLMDMVSQTRSDRQMIEDICLLYTEHIHSLIDRPLIILGVGIYATISNCLLAIALLCMIRFLNKIQKK